MKNSIAGPASALLLGLLIPAGCRAQTNATPALSVDFATTQPDDILTPGAVPAPTVTTDPAEEVDGSASLKADSQPFHYQWNEFFHLKPGYFAARTAYVVSFNYKILASNPATKFYALFRHSGGNTGQTEQFKQFTGDPGATGTAVLNFPADTDADFGLVIGIENQGAIAINRLTIVPDPAHTPGPGGPVIASSTEPEDAAVTLPNVKLPHPERTFTSPGATNYYLDSVSGDDASDGHTPDHAWKSLDKVNATRFAPGDKILLHRGSRWTGFLCPGGSGSGAAPVIVDAYGDGPLPRIDGAQTTLAAFMLRNSEYYEVHHLELTNAGPTPIAQLNGVVLLADNYGDLHHIVLDGLYIHDVDGSLLKNPAGGAGIRCLRGEGGKLSRFDDLLVENCRLVHVDRNGFMMDGNVWRPHWYPSLHVVIRNNYLEDIGGDGIVPIACDGPLVEHNRIVGAHTRTHSYAVGIYPWSCDNAVIQFNEVSGVKSTKDGEGYDCDFNCTNTLMQYNYSHDNEGGFMLICDLGSISPKLNIGNQNITIRYNLSVNDGALAFLINGPCQGTRVYNNTVSMPPGQKLALTTWNWGGTWPSDAIFRNNVFILSPGGRAAFDPGKTEGLVFDHNAFYGDFRNRPGDPSNLTVDPELLKPGTADPRNYAPGPGSPLLTSGAVIPDNGGHDLFGAPVPQHAAPTIGAFQSAPPPNAPVPWGMLENGQAH